MTGDDIFPAISRAVGSDNCHWVIELFNKNSPPSCKGYMVSIQKPQKLKR